MISILLHILPLILLCSITINKTKIKLLPCVLGKLIFNFTWYSAFGHLPRYFRLMWRGNNCFWSFPVGWEVRMRSAGIWFIVNDLIWWTGPVFQSMESTLWTSCWCVTLGQTESRKSCNCVCAFVSVCALATRNIWLVWITRNMVKSWPQGDPWHTYSNTPFFSCSDNRRSTS